MLNLVYIKNYRTIVSIVDNKEKIYCGYYLNIKISNFLIIL